MKTLKVRNMAFYMNRLDAALQSMTPGARRAWELGTDRKPEVWRLLSRRDHKALGLARDAVEQVAALSRQLLRQEERTAEHVLCLEHNSQRGELYYDRESRTFALVEEDGFRCLQAALPDGTPLAVRICGEWYPVVLRRVRAPALPAGEPSWWLEGTMLYDRDISGLTARLFTNGAVRSADRPP